MNCVCVLFHNSHIFFSCVYFIYMLKQSLFVVYLLLQPRIDAERKSKKELEREKERGIKKTQVENISIVYGSEGTDECFIIVYLT